MVRTGMPVVLVTRLVVAPQRDVAVNLFIRQQRGLPKMRFEVNVSELGPDPAHLEQRILERVGVNRAALELTVQRRFCVE